jgi:hypothetical protein
MDYYHFTISADSFDKFDLYFDYTSDSRVMEFRFHCKDFGIIVKGQMPLGKEGKISGYNYSLSCYGELYNYLSHLKWPVSLEELCGNLSKFLSIISDGSYDMDITIFNKYGDISNNIMISDNECMYLYFNTENEEITWGKDSDFIYIVKRTDGNVSVSVSSDSRVSYNGPINIDLFFSKVINPVELLTIEPIITAQEKLEETKALSRVLSKNQ